MSESFAERFLGGALLSTSGEVQTFATSDRLTGEPVLLQTAPARAVPPSVRARLDAFRKAMKETPAGFAAPTELGDESETFYAARPYLPGRSLASLASEHPLAAPEVVQLGIHLLALLEQLHGRQLLHLGIHPLNVIVPLAGELSRASLVLSLREALPLGKTAAERGGTLASSAEFVSPEYAGALKAPIDARSDLFSLGCVLYYALTGHPPFQADSLGEVLRRQLEDSPPIVRALVSAPRALDDLIGKLLRTEPQDRYQTAAGALADLRDIAAHHLRGGRAELRLPLGTHDLRKELTEPSFIDRDAELDRLDEWLTQTAGGEGVLGFLEAESGGGKSRVLDELAYRAGARHVRVFRGQAVGQAAQRPFQLLDGVLQTLRASSRTDGALLSQVREAVGGHANTIAAALPELAGLFELSAPAPIGPEAFGEYRAMNALALLLDSLGSPGRPAVVLLDDVQWTDALTVQLLHHWQRQRRPGPRHVSILASFRSEEVAADHPLRGITPSLHLVLQPLAPGDQRSLALSMAGPLPEAALEVLLQLSGGSPFMVSAVLRGMVEAEALRPGRAGWEADLPTLAEHRSSRGAAAYLSNRLQLLPASTRQLLAAAAVLGKEFDATSAARLAGRSRDDSLAALEQSRARHILWKVPGGDRWAFVHDKLRETALGMLSREELAALHFEAARAIEQSGADQPFELAYHYDATGRSDRALPFALAAAAQARARSALDVAERQYRIAKRGAASARPQVRREIAVGLGEVLMLRGQYDEAEAELKEARRLSRTAVERAELGGKLGELAFKRDDVERACAHVEGALRTLGRFVPRGVLLCWPLLLWETAKQLLHTLFPRLFLGRRPLEGAEQQLLAVRLYSRLAYVNWFFRGRAETAWAHLREMNLAERFRPTPELAQAYSEHAPVATMVPLFARGIRYAERSLVIRRELGDLWGQGQSLHFHGVVLYAASRFEEAIRYFTDAIQLLERTGDRWEVNTARWNLAFSHYRLGRAREAIAIARQVHRDGVKIGDFQASAISLSAWSKASFGQLPEDDLARELARPRQDGATVAELRQAEAVRLLAEQRPAEAAALLGATWSEVKRRGLRQEYVAPIPAWWATALRAQLQASPWWADRRRRRLVRELGRVSRVALRWSRWYRNNLPHALREAGYLAAFAGRVRRAARLFERSARVAAAQRAQLELARTRLARAEVARELAAPRLEVDDAATLEAAAQLVRDAEHPESAPGPGSVSFSLADRFSALLDAGRNIATALSRETIHHAMHEAIERLLRGERCALMRVEYGADVASFAPLAGEPDLRRHEALLRAAVERRRPVTLDELRELADDELDSRSALAAPIFQRSELVAVFLVTHGVAGLFGEDERRLAAFIATLAGAALENAAGFAEVQALSRSLEARVQERTAELVASQRELESQTLRAQEASRLKSEFLANMSHELRTPLNSIIGFSELLYDGKLGTVAPKHVEYLGDILSSARHLMQLINDVLDLSKVEAGKLQFHPEPVHLTDLVQGVHDVVRGLAIRKRMALFTEIDPAVNDLVIDPARLKQVLYNYLSNALKFTPDGGRIVVRAREDGPDRFRIEVEDDGPGIARESQSQLFVKFRQLDSGSAKRFQGTGLGLALTKQLVEAQGGRVGVFSEPGKGSLFWASLPRRQRPEEHPSSPPAEELGAGPPLTVPAPLAAAPGGAP